MISNPKHGWCDFKLGGFIGHPSYLTDVPIEMLKMMITRFKSGASSLVFDEEGSCFTLVLTHEGNYIIVDKEEISLIILPWELEIQEVAQELIDDIESDLDGWINFTYDCSDTNLMRRKETICGLVDELKALLRTGEKEDDEKVKRSI